MCVGIGIVPMGKGGGAFLPPPPFPSPYRPLVQLVQRYLIA
jgi:hypothetical protein